MTDISDYKRRRAQESARKNFQTHGLSKHPLYDIWRGIQRRCYDERHIAYCNYGGRGISMDPLWENSLAAFILGVEMEIGARPSKDYTLDRIHNDLGYFPGNLRWATAKEQAGNRRPRRRRYPQPDGDEHGLRECLCNYDCQEMRNCPWYDELSTELGELHEGWLGSLVGRSA